MHCFNQLDSEYFKYQFTKMQIKSRPPLSNQPQIRFNKPTEPQVSLAHSNNQLYYSLDRSNFHTQTAGGQFPQVQSNFEEQNLQNALKSVVRTSNTGPQLSNHKLNQAVLGIYHQKQHIQVEDYPISQQDNDFYFPNPPNQMTFSRRKKIFQSGNNKFNEAQPVHPIKMQPNAFTNPLQSTTINEPKIYFSKILQAEEQIATQPHFRKISSIQSDKIHKNIEFQPYAATRSKITSTLPFQRNREFGNINRITIRNQQKPSKWQSRERIKQEQLQKMIDIFPKFIERIQKHENILWEINKKLDRQNQRQNEAEKQYQKMMKNSEKMVKNQQIQIRQIRSKLTENYTRELLHNEENIKLQLQIARNNRLQQIISENQLLYENIQQNKKHSERKLYQTEQQRMHLRFEELEIMRKEAELEVLKSKVKTKKMHNGMDSLSERSVNRQLERQTSRLDEVPLKEERSRKRERKQNGWEGSRLQYLD